MLRLAVLYDYPEELWPSMDLVAEMIVSELRDGTTRRVAKVSPAFRAICTNLPLLGQADAARNADRLINRHWHYPRHVRRHVVGRHDAYHVADHSYAHLVHALPPERTGVFCHDLDAFRSLLEPDRERRPAWFRAMMRRVLRGMQKAAIVFYSTGPVRRRIVELGLLDERRLVHAPYGVSSEYTPEPSSNESAVRALPPLDAVGSSPFLLHVGSCIPRKRIDVLLDVFSAVRERRPEVRLVQVGGEWTQAQREQLRRLGLEGHLTQLRGLSREQIAVLYRSALLVLQPSESEGFGLPVIEALACGAAVVASDIPVLREVGGVAADYCGVADVAAWAQTVGRIIEDPHSAPPRDARLGWASRYTWRAHGQTILDAYLRLLA
jgi:glycosyltransferase involved in cell wall biosynthesis